MFDELLTQLSANPHLAVFALMILCGLGLPIPEELILLGAGYICYLGKAEPLSLGLASAAAILVGDLLPFSLGRFFGPKILRNRLVRTWISKEKLALFDHWFQRRGWLTIFVARFLAGIRTPAFFTAGSMRLPFLKFLVIDGAGVLFSVPLSLGLGLHFGDQIDHAIALVHRTEKGLFVAAGIAFVVLTGIFWFRIRRRRRILGRDVREAFVGPSQPRGEAGAGAARPAGAPEIPAGGGPDESTQDAGEPARLPPPAGTAKAPPPEETATPGADPAAEPAAGPPKAAPDEPAGGSAGGGGTQAHAPPEERGGVPPAAGEALEDAPKPLPLPPLPRGSLEPPSSEG